MANDARPRCILRIQTPPVQPVNLPIEFDVIHLYPSLSILSDVFFDAAVEGIELPHILETCRPVYEVINRVVGQCFQQHSTLLPNVLLAGEELLRYGRVLKDQADLREQSCAITERS